MTCPSAHSSCKKSRATMAATMGVNVRRIVQEKVLAKMVKHVTQLTHGWVVLVVDDRTTRILSYAVRMSDLTDCGVSIIERLELKRQPFPEMNVVYFIAPTVENMRKMVLDFSDETKPKYSDVYLFLLHHASDEALEELKHAPPAFLSRLKALQEVNIDFLALEKCALSLDMNDALHLMYSPAANKDASQQLLHRISEKLVSVCATLEEYPYIRYKADQPRMEQLAQLFQMKMNDFVAKNSGFVYAPNRGTLIFVDRGQDAMAPLMHESTYQAMTYDLLEVEEEQISYQAETNSGTITKTAFLNENDAFWIEFRHTHIAKVSEEIGKRMTALSASNAGTSLGRGKSTDLRSMAAALRELPEYREVLGKLSQHLFLAGKAMDTFTKSCLLDASNLEQTMASGVDDSGKKLKHITIAKQLEDLFNDPKLSECDRFRVVAIFALTQDAMKEADRRKVQQGAALSKKYDLALANLQFVGGPSLYKQNGIAALTPEEIKDASKIAEAAEYSNARHAPKLKGMLVKALRRTLDESEYPFIIAPPIHPDASAEKKSGPISLRKKTPAKTPKPDAKSETENFSGDKTIVFMCGGATYSELRSVYEVRASEKRDIVLATTSFLKPSVYIESVANLLEPNPLPSAPLKSATNGAEVKPLSNGEIHIEMEKQQAQQAADTDGKLSLA